MVPGSRIRADRRHVAGALTLMAVLTCGRIQGGDARAMQILAESKDPVVLGSAPTVVRLEPRAVPSGGRRLHLLVRGLFAEEQPGVPYAAYLDLPDGAPPVGSDPHYAGEVHFFNARPRGAANAPDAESPLNADESKIFFSFDVTEALRTTAGRQGLDRSMRVVTLVPEGTPLSSAKPTISRIQLVEQ
jgi:hypothetical protein